MLEDFPEKRHNTLKINAIEHDLSEWHSKGQEFDSPMLHKKVADSAAFFCFRGLGGVLLIGKSTFIGRRWCRFRGWAVQVPKQGRNLRRESAFYVALVAQIPALKWNLRHLRLNLRRLSLNLRHRGASVHFRIPPSRCTYIVQERLPWRLCCR